MSNVRYREVEQDGVICIEDIHKLVVHSFVLGDAEDPDLYAAEPMFQWEESEVGQYVMSRAIEPPTWHRQLDATTYGWRYTIVAEMRGADATYFKLKWT